MRFSQVIYLFLVQYNMYFLFYFITFLRWVNTSAYSKFKTYVQTIKKVMLINPYV